MGSYALKNKFLKVNNTKYYRSDGIQLGDVGEKSTSIFSVNHVDAQSNIPAPKMKVKADSPLSMTADFAEEISGKLSFKGLTTSLFKKRLISGQLKLVRYFMENDNIENSIEDSPKLIESIKNFGRDARVVSDVWVIVEAEIYEKSKTNGGLKFKRSASADVKIENETTVVLGAGTVLAYMLQKIDWNEKLKKNWKTIAKLDQDQKGL